MAGKLRGGWDRPAGSHGTCMSESDAGAVRLMRRRTTSRSRLHPGVARHESLSNRPTDVSSSCYQVPQVSVDVVGGPDRGMAEPLGDHTRVLAGGNQRGGLWTQADARSLNSTTSSSPSALAARWSVSRPGVTSASFEACDGRLAVSILSASSV